MEEWGKLPMKFERNCNSIDLTTFLDDIDNESRISINMKIAKLKSFLLSGKCKNVFEIAADQNEMLKKSKTEIKIEHIFKQAKKRGIPKIEERITFSNTFKDGIKFKYGAININSLGPKRYGEFCVILKKGIFDTFNTLVFLKSPSTEYVRDSNLDIRTLKNEILKS